MQLAIQSDLKVDDSLNDEELVHFAKTGSEQAVRILIKRHNQRLFRIARGIVRDDAEAEDVVQETYVRGFTQLASFREESNITTWLTRIALNEAYSRLRKAKRKVELSEIDNLSGPDRGQILMYPTSPKSSNPEGEVARRQLRDVLEKAVDKLPGSFRMAFILRDIEGLSTDQTATYLSIKPETVKTRLHRARKIMRQEIESELSPYISELFPFDGARCAHMADKVIQRLQSKISL